MIRSVMNSLMNQGLVLYKRPELGDAAGNVAADINGDGEIQEQELILDTHETGSPDGKISGVEVLDFIVNHVAVMPKIKQLTELSAVIDQHAGYANSSWGPWREALDAITGDSDEALPQLKYEEYFQKVESVISQRATTEEKLTTVTLAGRPIQVSEVSYEDGVITSIVTAGEANEIALANDQLVMVKGDQKLAVNAAGKCFGWINVVKPTEIMGIEERLAVGLVSKLKVDANGKVVEAYGYDTEVTLLGDQKVKASKVMYAENEIQWSFKEPVNVFFSPCVVHVSAMSLKNDGNYDVTIAQNAQIKLINGNLVDVFAADSNVSYSPHVEHSGFYGYITFERPTRINPFENTTNRDEMTISMFFAEPYQISARNIRLSVEGRISSVLLSRSQLLLFRGETQRQVMAKSVNGSPIFIERANGRYELDEDGFAEVRTH